MDKKKVVKIFSSFEEEYKRRRQKTNEDRIREFSILMERRWGKDWPYKPIEKIVTYEKTNWDKK